MDAREQRGKVIAETCTITQQGKLWRVPSQSGNGTYSVSLSRSFCTCPDHADSGVICKHIYAVRISVSRSVKESDGTTTTETLTVERKTYQQPDWPAYNRGQVNEHRHFQALLADLCRTLPVPEGKRGRGRPALSPADSAFCAIYKTYSTMSARRFMGDLDESASKGYVSRVPHFNSVLNFFDSETATNILQDFVKLSAAPMIGLETQFAIDGTGFSGARYEKWFDEKWGAPKSKAAWVKLHAIVGTKTNVVAACAVTDKEQHDSPMLPPLVAEAAKLFKIKELSADKAYCGQENFEATEAIGASFYPAFKRNATGGIGGAYGKAFHAFQMNKEEYERHYHRRSNSESTFSAMKRKFGECVRSKNDLTMKNEVLAKVVCHNVCTVIGTAYELGVAPMIGLQTGCTSNREPAQLSA
jgi:transposase/predicted nucleic acid-binding Zn finger protein